MKKLRNPAVLALIALLLAIGIALGVATKSGANGGAISTTLRDDVEDPLTQTVIFGDPNGRSQGQMVPVTPKPKAPPEPPAARKIKKMAATKRTAPPEPVIPVSRNIMLYRSVQVVSAEDASELVPVAPPYRLIQCVLTNSIETRMAETPIIAMVTDDLYHDGKLIVPANSEVHGRIRGSNNGDRVATSQAWDIVLHEPQHDNRRVLTLSGVLLDKSVHGNSPDGGPAYGRSDGTAGLLGEEVVLDNSNTIKLFAASFLSGFTRDFKRRTNTAYGQTDDIGMSNAAIEGTADVMETYAKGIQREIEKGKFVRVPAGTEFYLYVTEAISLGDATPASSGAFSRKAQQIEADLKERAQLRETLTTETR